MKFKQVLEQTLFVKTTGYKPTVHDPKRSKFASKKVKKEKKNIHIRDYEKAVKNNTAYGVWVWPIKGKI